MRRLFRLALLAAACWPAAFAQFQLVQVSGSTTQPVPPVFNFGSLAPGQSVTAAFRLQNTSTAAAQLAAITLAGSGFILPALALPATIAPQGVFDFSVSFQAPAPGSYSANLQAGGNAVLLTATVTPHLTYQVITAAGPQPLGGTLNFGTVTLGASSVLRVAILNQTAQPMTAPAIAVSGSDFSLTGASPSGTLLQPLDTVSFSIAFAPTQATVRAGTLILGGSSYALTGSGQAPPLPTASLHLTLPQPGSAQQGTVSVALNSPAATEASGTVTLTFAAAPGIPFAAGQDPAIAFASGGQTAAFTVAAGAVSANFAGQSTAAFATGTTAGTLTFTLRFGDQATQQTVVVSPAAVALTAVQATRQSGAITVQAAGFDNTRSAGKLSFTFYDSAGNAIPPGAIAADATAAFTSYFQTSSLGGAFALTAVFPVTGSPALIAAVQIQLANSAGATSSARIAF